MKKETKNKIRVAMTGRKLSKETKKKISDSSIGKKHSEGTKRMFRKMRKGEKHPQWKGGRFKQGGYWYVYSPEHPNAKKNYVAEHRLVMEKFLGRYLKPYEIVHHLDGDRENNNIDNLAIVIKNPHYWQTKCPYCGKDYFVQ